MSLSTFPTVTDSAIQASKFNTSLKLSALTKAIYTALALIITNTATTTSFAAVQETDAAAIPTARFDEIRVTATSDKTAQNFGYTADSYSPLGIAMTLKDTPQSISIITEEELKNQKVTTLSEAINKAPGITILQRGAAGTGYSGIYARGNEVDNLLLDGTPTNLSSFSGVSSQGWATSPVSNYERLEVLKGGAALLGGSGYPGAQISLIRKRPDLSQPKTVTLTAGSRQQVGINGDASFALNGNGTVRARTVLGASQADNWKRHADSDQQGFYGIVEADVSPKTTLSLGAEWQKSDYEGSGVQGFNVFDTEGYATPFGKKDNHAADWSYAKNDKKNIFTEVKHRLNDNWTSKFEYNYTTSHWQQEQGVVGGAYIDHDTGMGNTTFTKTDIKPTEQSASLNINGKVKLRNRQHDVLLGVSGYDFHRKDPDYFYEQGDEVDVLHFDGKLAKPDPVEPATAEENIKQKSVYLATRFFPTDRLALILGGRWNDYDYHYTLDDPYAPTDDKAQKSKFSPYIGTVFKITPTVSAYASHSNTFKPQTYIDGDKKLLPPETGSNSEIGIKKEFFDGLLNTSASVFSTKKNNMAVRTGISDDGYYIFEPRDTKTTGAELEIGGQLADNWHIQGGYTYAKTKDQHDDNPVPYLPQHQIKLATDYQLTGNLSKWNVGGAVRWQSNTYANVDEDSHSLTDPTDKAAFERAKKSQRQKAYAVVDVNARYQLNEKTKLGLNLNNIFDENYRTAPDSHTYGEPRSVLASLEYAF